MTDTILSRAKVERLRRDAKKLSREQDIPLSVAQDRLAAEHGFANWSLMAKAANKTSASMRKQADHAAALAEQARRAQVLKALDSGAIPTEVMRQFSGHSKLLMTLYYTRYQSPRVIAAIEAARAKRTAPKTAGG